ncbi:MAG: VacJ family lipoprotein [Pseudomonadota bacterium]|nr:VacJ family lipoprotein [Pseudomonadota bacterium]
MVKIRHARAALGTVLVLSLSACVTLPPNAPRTPQDPWESWNRGVYKVNDKLDRAIAKPVARTYVRVLPQAIREGVSNFFDNLSMTTVMVNDALQGKFLASLTDLGRFAMNSTFGLGGLFDPASRAGIPHNNEDFGQTLGKWGLHPGPFLELPILGPSDLRDGPAKLVDAYTNPQQYINNTTVTWGLYGFRLVDTRAALLPLDDTLKNVYDPYAFIRDAYLQRRAYLVSDGKVTDDEPLVDPDADSSDTGKADSGKAAPPPTSPNKPDRR